MNRQQRRARNRKLKKSSIKKIEKVESAVMNMPTKCDECERPFDMTDKGGWDGWQIAVYDDGPINLVCPSCMRRHQMQCRKV